MFTFIPNDFWYIELSESVKSPRIVIIKPIIENISPIGILISTMTLSSYQKIIVNTIQMIPTKIARPTGRSYHGKFESMGSFGVSE